MLISGLCFVFHQLPTTLMIQMLTY
jgi:hypothetical protein